MELDPPEVIYEFGKSLIFSGVAIEPELIQESYLFIDIPGEKTLFSSPIYVQTNQSYTFEYPLKKQPLRAYSTITFWVEITMFDGARLTSKQSSLFYEDNRYSWIQRESPPFITYYYQGDLSFGQKILDIASSGLIHIQKLLPLSQPSMVRIYTYASAQELRETLQVAGQTWIGAHADPDLGIIMLSLPQGPSQQLEMERQIPHELMHILLYQEMDGMYENLPTWLVEGLASNAELYSNPDYMILLDSASKQNKLIPIKSLCEGFPKEASSAFLAYAISESITRFLLNTYGSSQMMLLLDAYRDGLQCDRGLEVVFNKNITQIEHDWRENELGEIIWQSTLGNITPWLLLFIIICCVPLSLFIINYKNNN